MSSPGSSLKFWLLLDASKDEAQFLAECPVCGAITTRRIDEVWRVGFIVCERGLEMIVLPGNLELLQSQAKEIEAKLDGCSAHIESEKDKKMAGIAGHFLEVELNSIYSGCQWHRDHVARPLSNIAFSAPVLRANQALHHSKIAIAEVQRRVGPNVHDSH
jgi:hypothetical protein